MCFDPAFILPKIIGLLLMCIWLFISLRKLRASKFADNVTGTVINVIDNPEASSILNKIATIEFMYEDKKITIEHYYSGSRNRFSSEVTVYVNKRDISRSVIKSHSKLAILFDFLVPLFFSALIIISFFRHCP